MAWSEPKSGTISSPSFLSPNRPPHRCAAGGFRSSTADGEPSEAIRERVVAARAIQNMRFAAYPDVHCNAQMTPAMIRQFASPDQAGLAKLKDAMTRLNMSARAYDRILKVARTIADLDGSDNVLARHIQEAISYRNLDRTDWAER